MLIPFSFTFKSPALHKHASASSLSKSSKVLILQFLVKCCKVHSVFKILSKPPFFKFQVCATNAHINYDFILSRTLNSPNLYINWADMWYPDYQNKKLNICMLNSFKGFHLSIKWAIMRYLDNQLRKKLNLCMLLQANEKILCKNQIRIQKMYSQFKYVQLHISAKTAVIKLLKFQQLIIYKSLLSCQLQCIKFRLHVKTLFLE